MKRTTRVTAIFLLTLGIAIPAMGDGKMYGLEEVPPAIPYQRALILFDDGVETLILQSKYATSVPAKDGSLGWVVPVPSTPEVASIHPLFAPGIFHNMSWQTRPHVTRVAPIVFSVIFYTIGVCTALGFILFVLTFVPSLRDTFRRHRRNFARCWCYGAVLWLGCWFLLLTGPRGKEGVEVISESNVGVYNVQVIRSDDSRDLIAWLNAHEFQFGEKDKAAFDAYIEDNWCFAVATIGPDENDEEWGLDFEGLSAPLVLRFPHEQPVYPLRLTGTGGFDTEVLVYLASDRKMACDDGLALHFAGVKSPDFLLRDLTAEESVDPEGFFKPEDLEFSYLCKFKGTLTPAEMSRDLVFTPANDNSEFRQRVVEWYRGRITMMPSVMMLINPLLPDHGIR